MTQDSSFIYLKVPIKWKAIYRKLLKLMAKQGYSMLEDCNSSCTGKGKQIINCWNMFNAACAALDDGNEKLALALIRTVIEELNDKFNLDIDYTEYADMTFDESKYDKIIFSNLPFFTKFVLESYNFTNFDELYTEIGANNATDFIEFVNGFIDNEKDSYIEASIDTDFEPNCEKNILYFDDEDDLIFKAELKNHIFIINLPEKYKVKEIWYNDGDFKSTLTPLLTVLFLSNTIRSYLYFNNDISSNKEITIQLEKNE